jgi:Flp pilus assembly protein TadG
MNRQSGATIVEFALVLMIFLTFFLGILDFARMLWTWNAATEATRWGARVAVVCDIGAPRVLASMQKFLPQLSSSNVQIDWYDASGSVSTTCNASNCAGVNVRIVNLNYVWLTPVGYGVQAAFPMPGFSTYLPREIMGQDPNSSTVCS